MSNFYAIANETLDQFRRADGSWTENLDDAEHLTIEAATEKQVELIRAEVITELVEVPLMHEAFYDDIHSRIDTLQDRLEQAGVTLTTRIGEGDETTWTFEVAGVTLRVTLAGPDSWEADYED